MRRTLLAITTGLLLAPAVAGCADDSSASDEPRATASASATATTAATTTTTTAGATPSDEIDPVQRNGRVADAQSHFGEKASSYDWLDYDPATDTGLFGGLTVVGPAGREATLSCPRDFPCPPYAGPTNSGAALGPGPDEVTTLVGDGMAQVIAYGGTLRRTIDLTATIADGGAVVGLDWATDGGRLAVVTSTSSEAGIRFWVVDGAEGAPELAGTMAPPDRAWGNPRWSPDGQSLLLEVYDGGLYGADLVVLRLPPDGTASRSTVRTLYRSDRHFDWAGNFAWSPDGTRVAVRTKAPGSRGRHRITVISAEDGSVIAERPHLGGWLIWPAKPSPLPDGYLGPGRYRFVVRVDCEGVKDDPIACPAGVPDPPPIPLELTVPEGWVASNEFHLVESAGAGTGPPAGAALVMGWTSNTVGVQSDPCSSKSHELPDVEVGPGVDDFVDAVASQEWFRGPAPVDARVGGASGRYFTLEGPADLGRCAEWRPWDPGFFAQGPSNKWEVWVLDAGGHRVVIVADYFPGTSRKTIAQLRQMVRSIRFASS
jgi:hypothetical protein